VFALLIEGASVAKKQALVLGAGAGIMPQTRGAGTGIVRHPLNADHEMCKLVGLVAAEFALLEHILDLSIWALLGVREELAACVTGQMMGSRPRLQSIIMLIDKRGLGKELAEEATKLMNALFNVNEQRNRIVHDAWYIDPTTQEEAQFRSMPFKGKMFGMVDISRSDILKTTEEIKRKRESAGQLRRKVQDALASLP
jgi:hypothetical protein